MMDAMMKLQHHKGYANMSTQLRRLSCSVQPCSLPKKHPQRSTTTSNGERKEEMHVVVLAETILLYMQADSASPPWAPVSLQQQPHAWRDTHTRTCFHKHEHTQACIHDATTTHKGAFTTLLGLLPPPPPTHTPETSY